MHISQFKESKFLRKEDCAKGILLTIDRVEQQNVAKAGAPDELKFVLCFQEDVNPLVINMTNARLIASITGSEDTDDWHGHQIVCYNDPTIAYAGKVIGGIRVRAPRVAPRPAPPAPVAHTPAPRPAPASPAPVAAPPARPPATPAEAYLGAEEDDVPF